MRSSSEAIPSLKSVSIQVHSNAEQLAKAFESSSDGTTIQYTVRINRQAEPAIHHSLRWFNPEDEETLQDLLGARFNSRQEVEVRDEGMEELRVERWEDIEGWESEDEREGEGE